MLLSIAMVSSILQYWLILFLKSQENLYFSTLLKREKAFDFLSLSWGIEIEVFWWYQGV